MKRINVYLMIMTLFFLSHPAYSSDTGDGKIIIDRNNCASCHRMERPAANTIAEFTDKKAPDLFYAGSKYKDEFLEEYLQKPYRIRPSGPVYVNNIKSGEKLDRIQEPSLCSASLSKKDAEAAAKYLMALKDPNMETGIYREDVKYSRAMARITFFKSAVCNGCHQVKTMGKLEGGVSGATLYNAGLRLNGDWVFNYIKNPQYWDPKVPMPKMELPENKLLLLTNFVMSMKE